MHDRRAPSQTRPIVAAAVALLAALTVGGCSGSGKGDAASQAPATTAKATETTIDTNAFQAPKHRLNRFLPLKPGTQWVRVGATDVGHRRVPHRVISTVTDVYKRVNGVRAITVLDQDVDAGQIAQESLDYYAQDGKGNVWYVGSYTESYEGGRYVATQDAWLAGVKGGKAGLLMPGDAPKRDRLWAVAQPPGEDGDVAEVVKTGESRCVPFGCFKNVLVIREGKASAPDNEFKYYAPGVGQILNTPRSASQHHDVEKLVNLTYLRKQGLSEFSREALKLDRHATKTRPAVFGGAAPAKRAP